MGRRIRTTIPQTNKQLVPQWNFLEAFYEKNKQFKESQKVHFDRRHRAREPSPIPDDAEVWITSEGQPIQGRVLSQADTPRSYVVDTPTGTLVRNQSHLNVVPKAEIPETATETLQLLKQSTSPRKPLTPKVIMTRSKTDAATSKPNYR
jgi:hypothetical protein